MTLAFDDFYMQFYGERWLPIKEALCAEPIKWAWCNPHLPSAVETVAQFESARWVLWPKGQAIERRQVREGESLLDYYVLDPASCQVACALNPQPGEDVIDLCASPGGKALVLMNLMAGQGRFIANEFSPGRRENMQRILTQYFPRDSRDFLFVRGGDAQKFGIREPNAYDAVLADVPCSGERHLLANPEELKAWRPSRSKNLSVKQYSILSSAFLALRSGGRLVYSTCSLCPWENDAVIAKLLKRREGEIKIFRSKDEIHWLSPLLRDLAEETEHGFSFVPDRAGFGPMYFSVMCKS